MKVFYRICVVFSFSICVIVAACVSVFLLSKPEKAIISEKTYLHIDQYEIERIQIGDSLSFYCFSSHECDKNVAIALGYTLFDKEKKTFQFLLEDPSTYFQVAINMQEDITCQEIQK